MAELGYRLPVNQTIDDTFRFLLWDQFPVLLDKSVKYNSVLPLTGVYQHFNTDVVEFKKQLLEMYDREFTLSGIGSFIDYDRYGQNIKRPSPQLRTTGCAANSLCLEPTCFGFTEGVLENNQIMQNICWSLAMPCLKDHYYSDRQYDRKMRSYFKMFFSQPIAVAQAYQRTRLIKEAIKIVATNKNIRYTGSLVGGSSGLSLPFWINPSDPYSFPLTADLPAGVGVGGFNLQAFVQFMANRLFAGNFGGGMLGFKVYGLKQDYQVAKQQTSSVVQDYAQLAILERLANGKISSDYIDSMLGGAFQEDGMFPTFKLDDNTQFELITQEVLEPATIAGYVQTANAEHNMAPYRGLLFVPNNWKFNFVQPPKDDFSDLGLGSALNFRMNTPGVFPILSSSLFTNREVGEDGTFYLGQTVGPNGMIMPSVQGLRQRPQAIMEAIRTQVFMTYSQIECTGGGGQLPNVGRPMVPQAAADGFSLKSTMYVGTDVYGSAKPVLVLFATDTPQSAKPIEVCTTEDIPLDQAGEPSIANCCPGDQTYAILTFSLEGSDITPDMSDYFAAEDAVAYRTGAKGSTYLAEVTAVSGAVVSIQASGEGVTLPCCSGSPDDYGTRAVLISLEDITNRTSEIFKAMYDTGTSSLMIELLEPILDVAENDPVTITLENGDVINLLANADGGGLFLELVLAPGETCTLADLDCNCLDRATLTVPE